MPGLVPGIHVLETHNKKKGVDGRAKPGHDEVVRLAPRFIASFQLSATLTADSESSTPKQR
jgi:hypothetical protein